MEKSTTSNKEIDLKSEPLNITPGQRVPRIEDIFGFIPRVTTAPTWNPRKFNEQIAVDETANRLYIYNFTSATWKFCALS